MANHKCVDYTLYLVTDSSLVPAGETLLGQIEKALKGGVTIVQLREKTMETGPFIDLALKVKALTRKYNVPFIINDRIDVALAVDVDGVHIGQDDMPLAQARQLLGYGKIIGVSCNTIDEAKRAREAGADYLGIGTVWFTTTKEIKKTKQLLGVEGVKQMMTALADDPIPAVAIGGIKLDNVKDVVSGGGEILNGVAVVSAIIAASDPTAVCQEFRSIIRSVKKLDTLPYGISCAEFSSRYIPEIIRKLRKSTRLVHHITNNVVINDNANATLAVGASPIMSTNRVEMEELAAVNGALVLNMGTLNDIDTMVLAAQANNRHGHPVVLDPVGSGATTFRKQVVQRFLSETRITIIKGNGGEILSMANRGGRSQGVDTLGNVDETTAILAVRELALKHQCIVAMTGPIDYVSDGVRTFAIENGDPMLARITGSGCMVTSIVACFAAAFKYDYLLATVTGILLVTVASEVAMERADVKGPGTFRSALIDELYNLTQADSSVLTQRAKVRSIFREDRRLD